MKKKKYYLAPLEGITTWIYRKAHAEVYGALDKYFIPFIEPHEKRDFKNRELQEIMPEHNEGICVIPQILTNRSEGFLKLCHALKEFGYEEVNLNLGCPSRTVVSKKKGSGFLAFPEELDHFLEDIFSNMDSGMKLSVKTRIGKDDPEEFVRLLEIYNKYPLEELIIHPRVQTDYYKNEPRMDVFGMAEKESKNPVCYNGDLFTESRIYQFCEEFPEEDRMMIGRGMLVNPGLLSGENSIEKFRTFHDRIYEGYRERGMGDVNVLYKMKELWRYQIHFFPDSEKYAKQIKKTQKLSEYEQIVKELLRERKLRPLP